MNKDKLNNYCKYCPEIRHKTCRHDHCPFMLSRAKLEVVDFSDAVNDSFRKSKSRKFRKRLGKYSKRFDGNWFLSENHKIEFFNAKNYSAPAKSVENLYFSTIYLLTANEDLWERAKLFVGDYNINFDEIKLYDADTQTYAIYIVAKQIWYGKLKLDNDELADCKLIKNKTFSTIINAILIKNYGKNILNYFKGDQNEINSKN